MVYALVDGVKMIIALLSVVTWYLLSMVNGWESLEFVLSAGQTQSSDIWSAINNIFTKNRAAFAHSNVTKAGRQHISKE